VKANSPDKIIIGVTAASGAVYARTIISKIYSLKGNSIDVGIVFSENARKVWQYELDNDDFKTLPYKIYENNDFFAPPASGSAVADAMIICPCTMGTLARIASGVSSDLMSRAADVILKERKKLILLVREAPLNLIHIKNMETVTLAGGIIYPASPNFYSKPAVYDEIIETVTNRVLKLAGFEFDSFSWGEGT